MPNLLQAVKFENKPVKLLEKDNDIINNFGKVIDLYKQSLEYLGETPELKNKINNKLKNESLEIRKNSWITERRLPPKLKKIPSCDGEYSDILTALNHLPKVKISEYRTLANIFNMVIIPVEYTEIDKLFDIEDNSYELKKGYKYFNELLRQDTTTNYQCYLLCPIDYYNVWEQIKSDVIKGIYYSDYFENIFQTLDLIIPTQKNLYMATKTNDENLKSLAQSFDINIKTLSDKINSISNKLNKLETEFINEKYRNRQVQMNLESQNQQLQNTILKQQKQIEYLYCRLDPILFAVPENIDITNDDITSVVGLCWGKDIDEIIFEMKNTLIIQDDFKKINPINIESKMLKENFTLDYNKIMDRYKYILEIIKKNIQELNNRRYNKYWNRRYNTIFPIELSNNLNLIFEYEKENNEPRMIKTITIQNSYDRSVIEPVVCDDYDGRNKKYLNEDDLNNNERFINAYNSSFKEIAKRFNALEIN